jgi:UDP-N-acetyl-D-mannosaminuronic acid dehydrogenase
MRTMTTRLTVVGLGYIGLPTAAVFAEAGFTVAGVDVNPDAVEAINEGRAHIFEPGLDQLVKEVVTSGAFSASAEMSPAESFVIAVPTPFMGDHEPDLSYVEAASRAIAPLLERGNLIVLESTSPVGATEQVAQWIQELRPDLTVPVNGNPGDIAIAYCPERVLPGKILYEIRNNDRLLGGLSPACAQQAVDLYSEVAAGKCHTTTARTAELAKLSENAFRDVNIAFANELSVIADRYGIDARELIGLANLHPRVNILQPGPGVGGHCIAVDPWFIVDSAPDVALLIKQARLTNDAKPSWVVDKVLAAIGLVGSPSVACLGLAYKPDIDDLRESPAIEVVKQLRSRTDVSIAVVEPNVTQLPAQLAGDNVELVGLDAALAEANIIVMLVSHGEFVALDASAFGEAIVVDTVGVLDSIKMSGL